MAAGARVVIVGAGLGGIRTAEELRRNGFSGSITLLGQEEFVPYDRPPLSKGILRSAASTLPALLTPEELSGLDLDLRLGVRVAELDHPSRTVRASTGESFEFDSLVIATGASPRLLRGLSPRPGLHVLRTFNDARALSEDIRNKGSLVVIGAGFIGCEVAAAARELNAQVTLIEALSTPLSIPVGEFVGQEVLQLHRDNDVNVYCDSIVTRIVGDDQLEGVELSTGEVIPAGAVVVGLGVSPAVEWLQSSGIALEDGIVCNSSGRTSFSDVFAVGDVANWSSPYGPRGRHEHWTSAVDQARVVAANIVGSADPKRIALFELPYFWSDLYGLKLQALGWPSGAIDATPVRLGGQKLAVLYSDHQQFKGIVGISCPRIVMGMRTLLTEGATVEDALDRLS